MCGDFGRPMRKVDSLQRIYLGLETMTDKNSSMLLLLMFMNLCMRIIVSAAPDGMSLYSTGYSVSTSTWGTGGIFTIEFPVAFPLPSDAKIWTQIVFDSDSIRITGSVWTTYSNDGYVTQNGAIATIHETALYGIGSNSLIFHCQVTARRQITDNDVRSATLYIQSSVVPTSTVKDTPAPTYWWEHLVPTPSPAAAATPAPTATLQGTPALSNATFPADTGAGSAGAASSSSPNVTTLLIGMVYVLIIVGIGAAIIIYRELQKRKARRSQFDETSGLLSGNRSRNSSMGRSRESSAAASKSRGSSSSPVHRV